MERVHVWATWQEVEPERLRHAVAVVMDVCLATTTLLTAYESGARTVHPADTVEEAIRLSAGLPGCLRGGEQNGEDIPGFDLGPLPTLYTPERVRGRDVVFVTTNGTRAIRAAEGADRLFIACLRNADATAEYLRTLEADDVYLICAGSRGHLSLEDFICAGWITERLCAEGTRLNDAARLARALANQRDPAEWVADGRVGRWLARQGLADVVRFVGTVGESQTVIEVRGGRIAGVP
ncbi:2-phosphosulfolactate phosphatase [Alicyclobacillus sp.]|uniref:2-phosphosulfolactate phosphatase n=1 Tax=Alicyclobacillus sp. TaxID=61169 RepID=UPI0025C04E91|nr:2-phosphosulfolactate phosphatase [Alicyclobacillus sp.]MCL6515934.1 2-phosphosulfolactate phosphatase [Alicyclobacillus sp.]